ncbi:homogentisate geranylgeranyltransferase [Citrus sinensis]|uniref:Homogentisate phytyltransferase 1 n=1 Tax=Citrus sinensis TaxID=2711 RepID=A0ACB8HS98_CITSI|nr:homogentisate geranylgeranyltransferase [Citrus sinensis]KAH9677679.1 putative homogentisate phytyltransferase 1 [Citrus sinensis]
MLLQINPRSSFSLKYHPLQHAAQDGYSSESELVSTSFMQVLNKKCDAFYRLTRPYSCVSIIAALLSVSLLPLQNPADFTPKLIIEAFKCMVPAIMMNNYANAINQLADVHIDKVNKPHLPLACGDFSMGEGLAITIASPLMAVAMGIMLRSPPLVIGFIIWCIVGGAYSIDKIVLGNPVSFTKPVLFTAAYMVIWNAAIAFVKDIPDVEGDKAFGLRTLPIIIGKEKVFSIAVNMMLMAYGGAVLVGAFSPSVLCKLVTMIGHSALAFVLWRQAKTIDLSHNKSVQSFYLFIWKLLTGQEPRHQLSKDELTSSVDISNQLTDVDVREEYAHAFQIESYNEFWTRVLTLSNKDSAKSVQVESTTTARISSSRLFAEQLLDLDQSTVIRILDLVKTPSLIYDYC